MSANRCVIARENGVTEKECECRFCKNHSSFINDMLWCLLWDSAIPADSFCSFFDFGKDGDK